MTGAELIAAERARQITEEGFTPEHDAEHANGNLTDAAACYLGLARAQITPHDEVVARLMARTVPHGWPFRDGWKPSPNALRNLVRSGALIAAEIDRLQAGREEGK